MFPSKIDRESLIGIPFPYGLIHVVNEHESRLMHQLYADRVPMALSQQKSSTMAAVFAQTNPNHLLLGNETGNVSLVDCRRRSPGGDSLAFLGMPSFPDAVFDACWQPDDGCYALAVGDKHVYVYDSQLLKVRQCLGYHESSIRTVRYRPNNINILATAGRDGQIAFWDLRTTDTNSARNRPINVIRGAHNIQGNEKRRESNYNSCSVTAFEFMPLEDHLLCSIGQPDYSIRFWDVRYTRKRKNDASISPLTEIEPPLCGRRPRAFISLCTNSQGSSLYAVSSDNHIYHYLNSNQMLLETLSTPGFRTSGSFYIRSCMSPDDAFLLCGSTEGNAYIWPLSNRRKSIFKLEEHRYEVSCVAWSQNGNIFVGGEDYVSRVWYADGQSVDIDPARHVRPELISVPQLNALPKSYRMSTTWKKDFYSTLDTMDPWPSRSSPIPPARIPLGNLSAFSPMNQTPTSRKRQSLIDSFFTTTNKKQSRPGNSPISHITRSDISMEDQENTTTITNSRL